MNQKDYITITVSSIALILSIISLIITIIQKNRETKRSIRKSLSDSLESISKINIESEKLNHDSENANSEQFIAIRRWYNSQRRIIVAHCDFLIDRYKHLPTESDCNALAVAHEFFGNIEKSKEYWNKTIKLSQVKSIKHMNLRGYGRFLFYQNEIELGRNKFREALQIVFPNNDFYLKLESETYALWARMEKTFNSELSEYVHLLQFAAEKCSLIGNFRTRKEMEKFIEYIKNTKKEDFAKIY